MSTSLDRRVWRDGVAGPADFGEGRSSTQHGAASAWRRCARPCVVGPVRRVPCPLHDRTDRSVFAKPRRGALRGRRLSDTSMLDGHGASTGDGLAGIGRQRKNVLRPPLPRTRTVPAPQSKSARSSPRPLHSEAESCHQQQTAWSRRPASEFLRRQRRRRCSTSRAGIDFGTVEKRQQATRVPSPQGLRPGLLSGAPTVETRVVGHHQSGSFG